VAKILHELSLGEIEMTERSDCDFEIEDIYSGGNNFLVSSVMMLRDQKRELQKKVHELQVRLDALEKKKKPNDPERPFVAS
jgi:hypothetical protein